MFIQAPNPPAHVQKVDGVEKIKAQLKNETGLIIETFSLLGFHPVQAGISKDLDLFIILDDHLSKEIVDKLCIELKFLNKLYIIDSDKRVWLLEKNDSKIIKL